MSLFDAAAELEYVPQDDLIRLSQDPNSRFPQFLVLSEVQRRTQMRRMYENQLAKQNQPTMTVADEAVMELANQGAMPSEPSSQVVNDNSQLSPIGLSSMAPTEQPMRQMAEGGSTSDDSQNLLEKIADIDALKFSGLGMMANMITNHPDKLGLLPALYSMSRDDDEESLIDPTIPDSQVTPMAEGGSTSIGSIGNWIKENPLEAASYGLIAIPGVGLGYGALRAGLAGLMKFGPKAFQAAKTGLPKLGQKLKGTYSTPPVVGTTKVRTGTGVGSVPTPIVTPRAFSKKRLGITSTALGTLGLGSSALMGSDTTPQTGQTQTQDQDTDTSAGLQSILDSLPSASADYQPVNKRQQGQDLAKLGFAILASPNMQQLGQNLYNMVDDMQKRKGTGLEKAQQSYYEAKVAELEQELANKPYQDLMTEYNAVTKAIETLYESGQEESPAYISAMVRLQALNAILAKRRGIDVEGSLVGGATVN
jgi:hypothetical protein